MGQPVHRPTTARRLRRQAARLGAPAGAAALLLGVVPAGTAAASGTAAPSPAGPVCTAPDGTQFPYHCYDPAQITAAYGVDGVHDAGLDGAGQTIVLVDAYGSPTAAGDLAHFAATYGLPAPTFDEVYPLGRPDYSHAPARDNGQSGPAAAAGWAGEASLDIEWADAIAPRAHIVLLAAPPAETQGVQGLPNLMKAIAWAEQRYPAGTVFSMSFGTDESAFGGSSATSQFARFDQTFEAGLAKGDTFFSSAGDYGTTGVTKQARASRTATTPQVSYPNASPYVVSVGGTQLQYGWQWDPTSDVPFNPDGSFNPGYFHYTTHPGRTEVVWNEPWLPAATGGGSSTVYPRPAWQASLPSSLGAGRLVPDLAWNAAVDGGVLTYETYPPAWGLSGLDAWYPYGGTSAAGPQVAALTALANQGRSMQGHGPIGWLDPLLYSGVGASPGAFHDITPTTEGTATAGTALTGNQLWQYNADGTVAPGPVPGRATTAGYDTTTGWGSPDGPGYVAALEGATPVAVTP